MDVAAILPRRLPVHCCIEIVDQDGTRVVRVAGRLADLNVSDLLVACSEARGTLRVDLTDVSSVDVVATEVLRRVRDAGAQLQGVPRYIQFALNASAPRSRHTP